MKPFLKQRLSIGSGTLRKFMLLCIVLMSAFALTACNAKESAMVGGLTGVVFNYSQDSIAFVKINGHEVGGGLHKAKVGEVKGGGGGICCALELSPHDKTVDVQVAGSGGKYTVKAIIEHPWPPDPNTATVHILPGRKIVIEVGFAEIGGRKDLIESQIKALGLKQEAPYNDLMRTGAHKFTEFYQQKK